jgi:hypothetical protein
MSLLRTLKKLVFGETWLLPVGLALTIAASLLVRHLLGADWRDVGGFVLLAGVTTTLVVSVAVSGRPR